MVLGGLQESFQQRHPQACQVPASPTPGPAIFLHSLPPSPASDFSVWRLRYVHLNPVSKKELETLPTGLTSEHTGPGRGQHSCTGQRTRGLLGYVVWSGLRMPQGLLGVVVLGPRKRALQAVLGGVVSGRGPKFYRGLGVSRGRERERFPALALAVK